jgi:hypothetical protein
VKEILFVWDPKRTYSGKITDSKEQNPCKEANHRVGVKAITIVFGTRSLPRRARVGVGGGSHGDESEAGHRRGCVASRNLVATDIWVNFGASIVVLPCSLGR